jgi:hypothetical protein
MARATDRTAANERILSQANCFEDTPRHVGVTKRMYNSRIQESKEKQ